MQRRFDGRSAIALTAFYIYLTQTRALVEPPPLSLSNPSTLADALINHARFLGAVVCEVLCAFTTGLVLFFLLLLFFCFFFFYFFVLVFFKHIYFAGAILIWRGEGGCAKTPVTLALVLFFFSSFFNANGSLWAGAIYNEVNFIYTSSSRRCYDDKNNKEKRKKLTIFDYYNFFFFFATRKIASQRQKLTHFVKLSN